MQLETTMENTRETFQDTGIVDDNLNRVPRAQETA
jgi:hypothetical protein